MATLYISEFSDLPFVSNGVIQAPDASSWLADQTVTIGSSSAASSAFNKDTKYILVSADAVCSIAWTAAGKTTVAATATNFRLPSGLITPFGVTPGMIVSAITNP